MTERRKNTTTPLALRLCLAGIALCAHATQLLAQPTIRFKSPADGMHFAASIPIRLLADGYDPEGWRWNFGRTEPDAVTFFVDGAQIARVEPTDGKIDWFEAFATGLQPGPHTLRVDSLNWNGVVVVGTPIVIVVDPFPTKGGTVTLTQDLELSGAADLNWNNVVVQGNGFKVTSAPDWSGAVRISDSFIVGLGAFGTPGIDIETTGDVVIANSTFDGTGAVHVKVNGSGILDVAANEFRASNKIEFEPSNPDMSPVFFASGSTTGSKRFRGNRVGAGIVQFYSMSDVLIGGDSDVDSNVLIGPRAVIRLDRCSHITVRGNYDHHDYHGGWSQGFNFDFMSYSTDLLIEHNVIRSGSWPVQDLSGIFRYNLVVEIGHTWLRTASSGTRIHHNVFLHPGDQLGPNAGVDAGILFYQDEQGIEIYNNTFDAGGTSSQMLAPILTVSGNARVGSFYNNVVTGFMTQAPRGLVAREAASASGSRIDFADYNVFYNPLTNSPHYETGTVVSGLGAHDVDTNPRFAIGSQIPYAIDEKQVWSGALRVSQVLAHYRELYTPAVGSPLIDAGGPAGLAGVDIGAIEGESGAQRPEDLFGKFGARTDTLPPRPPSHLFVQ